MVKMVSLKCPECGARLSIEEGHRQCFCQYCGTKIMLDDGSKTYTYHRVDEARLKEAEVEERIRLKELEIEEQRRISKEKTKLFKIKASIILGIIGAILMVVGFVGGEATGNPDSSIYMFAFIGLFAFGAIMWIWIGGSNENDK